MKIDLTAIDLDPLADFDIFFLVIALTIAFVLFLVVRYDLKRLRITLPDPFFYPIGDVPNIPPLPAESLLDQDNNRSARRAAPAGQGSGGHGKSSCGPAAATPIQGRGRRAF